jgi:predicted RNA-binding protein
MKKTKNLVITAILLVVLGPARSTQAQTAGTEQGIDAVEVMNVTATVEKVDLEKRKVTILLEDGKHKTVKVDKSVQNLDRVKVGDHLKLAYTEEIIIMVGKSNETPGAAAAGAVGVAPEGAKPGMVMVDTAVVSGKILAVDAQKHRLTIEDPDGKKKTLKVSKKVTNLEQLKAGDTIDMSVTEALAVEIVK